MPDYRQLLSRIGRSWREAIRDVVLIVLSILIAFALDAWWQYRGDRREELRLLADLESEFVAARAELERVRAYNAEKVVATRALLAFTAGSAPATPGDSVLALWRRTLGSRSYDPPRGVTDGILASGGLGLIRDDTLARLLASWPSRVENLARPEENLRVVYRDEILPWLQDRTPMPHGDAAGPSSPDLAGVLNDFAYQNRLGWIVAQAELILVEAAPVTATIDSILTRTRSALGRRRRRGHRRAGRGLTT